MSQAIRRFISLFVALAILGASALAWSERTAIYDWARLRDYQPPAEIAQLATDTTMTEAGRRLFYVFHPQLDDRTAFNQNCAHQDEQTIVLGCYVTATGIYLFDVDDPRLQGVEQVTAAHELLHAAYDRLSEQERADVNRLTLQVANSLTDERIKNTIENYRRRDPNIVVNELHSIIATEVKDLPPELETYYKRYFTDRPKIVDYSEKYEGVLVERRNRATELETQITGLKSEIEQLEKTLTSQRDELQADRSGADSAAEVTAFNQRVDSFNAEVRQLNNLIAQHNKLVEEYQANALEQQELFKALNSSPTL